MLQGIWAAIGIMIGLFILIPLVVLFVVIVFGCMKEMLNIVITASNVIAAWIDEKLYKK